MTTNDPQPPSVLDVWVANLRTELGISPDVDIDIGLLLDVARDAAHSVARPAAPLTTFLVGYASGFAAGSVAGSADGTPQPPARSIPELAAAASAFALASPSAPDGE